MLYVYWACGAMNHISIASVHVSGIQCSYLYKPLSPLCSPTYIFPITPSCGVERTIRSILSSICSFVLQVKQQVRVLFCIEYMALATYYYRLINTHWMMWSTFPWSISHNISLYPFSAGLPRQPRIGCGCELKSTMTARIPTAAADVNPRPRQPRIPNSTADVNSRPP